MARENLNIEEGQAKEFVQEIQKNAGLIKQLGTSEKYVYAHRSLHEFCVAKVLAETGEKGFNQLWPHIQNSRWRQTVIFYCSIDHEWAETLVKSLIEEVEGDNSDCSAKQSKNRMKLNLCPFWLA